MTVASGIEIEGRTRVPSRLPSRRSRLSLLATVLAMSAASCAGAPPSDAAGNRTGYQVIVNIQGKPAAFAGAQLEVGGKTAPAPTAAPDGDVQVEMTLCTADRTRFLGFPDLRIRIIRPDGAQVETLVPRMACRLSKNPGMVERLFVRLGEDGRIDAAFGSDPAIFTVCEPPNYFGLCPRDDF